jgi:hypothetical protein
VATLVAGAPVALCHNVSNFSIRECHSERLRPNLAAQPTEHIQWYVAAKPSRLSITVVPFYFLKLREPLLSRNKFKLNDKHIRDTEIWFRCASVFSFNKFHHSQRAWPLSSCFSVGQAHGEAFILRLTCKLRLLPLQVIMLKCVELAHPRTSTEHARVSHSAPPPADEARWKASH